MTQSRTPPYFYFYFISTYERVTGTEKQETTDEGHP